MTENYHPGCEVSVKERKDPVSDYFGISSPWQSQFWILKTNAAEGVNIGDVFIVIGSAVYDVISQ
ncbi:MAG: hypothetical protein Q7J56_00670 [Deltaproteobacteria bacterium]|nr:hypothetical protein [Deltaproteobacteria bacterium]